MAGRGMMGGMGMGRVMGGSTGAGGAEGGAGGGVISGESPAEGNPSSAATKGADSQAGAAAPTVIQGGGGGFGGGGVPDPNERDNRVGIARMSAALSTSDNNPRNQAIIKKLDDSISLHFANETPLEDVLKHLRQSFKGADGKRIPIYIDPVGLAEAEKTVTSPVAIDLDDVPLKFSLRLILKQLGLAYCIRDGVLIISSVNGIQQELMEAQAEQQGLNNPQQAGAMMGGVRRDDGWNGWSPGCWHEVGPAGPH